MSRHLVIVESPAKAKTIRRFLGKDYIVEASMGHIRDLPGSTLAVDIENDFEPEYVISEGKEAVVKKLKAQLKEVDDLWIATDEDREGEAIGWHLTQVLKEDPKTVKRIAFHEITESAIKAAIEHPRTLDMRMVDAQQARRVLDRLVGYTLSPFLWKKVYRGLSAGRVQSVAVRIIVDREREIRAFNPEEYWTVDALLKTAKDEEFIAHLNKKDGQKCEPTSQGDIDTILKDLASATFNVSHLDEKEIQKSPPPPFTTSTLQQEAARKLGFSVKQTMVVAQQLYEGIHIGGQDGLTGLITYMRTDSVNLSEKALADCKTTIQQLYGREYLLSEARKYKTKSKGAQEAHEAIRPTEVSRTPQSLSDVLDHQQLKLYTLIWNRTMATQMAGAQLKRVGADITAAAYTFRATGQTVLFDGYLRVYNEGRDEGDAKKEDDVEDGDRLLPALVVGEELSLSEALKAEQHFTKPPPRYTEASLVKKMEEEGIGRPSTYAPTISTIQQRGYITKEGKQLAPQDVAFMVTDLLSEHFANVVDLKFTAKMEHDLDEIAEGTHTGAQFLKGFYGPFNSLIKEKTEAITKADVMKERILGKDPATGLDVVARLGRFGPYVQLGHLEDLPAPTVVAAEPEADAPKGKKGKAKKPKKVKGPKPKSASLPKNRHLDDVTLEEALSLLQFPRTLGEHQGQPVTANLGRFGPYLKWGTVNASIPPEKNPAFMDLSEAIQLLTDTAERKQRAATPLRELGNNAEGKPVVIKDGRFGPYVTDGVTNASLGKKRTVEAMTLEEALEMLETKKKQGPRKWGRRAPKKSE